MGHEQSESQLNPTETDHHTDHILPHQDFGANGLRIGYIIDQHNPSFRESVRQISYVPVQPFLPPSPSPSPN